MIDTVFCDIDGILADFHQGILNLFGLTKEEFEAKVSPGIFWWDQHIDNDLMTKLTTKFWVDLPKTSDGDQILNLLEEEFGQKNICLLTNHVNIPDYAHGKIQWINQHYPRYGNQYLLGTSKHYCAHGGALLVDDADHNIDDFTSAGGEGLLIPRYWNKLYKYANRKDIIEHIKEILYWIN